MCHAPNGSKSELSKSAAKSSYLQNGGFRDRISWYGVVKFDNPSLMREIEARRRVFRTSAFRRVLTASLLAAYVIVGFGGEVSCAGKSFSDDASHDIAVWAERPNEGSKKPPVLVEHCYTCVPLVMPTPVFIAEPLAEPAKLSFDAPTLMLEDHRKLDTPPPKHLT
ncbi:MAG: hypothetical protein J0I29_06625 [Rhizobiales bacterium]|nr:hypothetical protein [Hyphomicrobiales bacterium]